MGKLVRDNIPNILEKEGKTFDITVLEAEEYANGLISVLSEEMNSFKQSFEAEDDELAVTKVADVMEVLFAILDLIGVEEKSFEKIRLARKQKYGSYQKKIAIDNIK